jgi:NAD(P)H dehydrogenase (quinone)
MPARIAVIHYSSTGNIHRPASAMAAGALDGGAEVRLRRVPELAPESATADNPRCAAHHASENGPGGTEVATLDDLAWADGIALGSPTRFGGPAAQLKNFLEQSGGLWFKGRLADKVVTSFTSASTAQGGLESTILGTLNLAYYWGAIVMPLGYRTPAVAGTGNPYGSSWVSRKGSAQGARLAAVVATALQLVQPGNGT